MAEDAGLDEVQGARPALDDEPVAVEAHVTDAQRRAALAAGAPKVPRRAVVWGFVAATVLTLGGVLGERLVSSVGLNPVAATTTTTTLHPTKGAPTAADALLSFDALPPVRLPAATLSTLGGRPFSLASLRGKVAVLTFFDASCRDSCPVVASEVRWADHDLGTRRDDVEFVTINTDPLELASSPAPPAATATGLDRLGNWRYLTGTVHELNPVWRAFGVSIDVYVDQKSVVHNDVLYLVDPTGQIVARGSPFSDESHRGVFSLPAPLERVAGATLAVAVARMLAR